MIKVTRLDGSELIVNCELVEFVEQTPDTVISLVNGRKIIVKEDAKAIVDKVIEYKRGIGRSRRLKRKPVADAEVEAWPSHKSSHTLPSATASNM